MWFDEGELELMPGSLAQKMRDVIQDLLPSTGLDTRKESELQAVYPHIQLNPILYSAAGQVPKEKLLASYKYAVEKGSPVDETGAGPHFHTFVGRLFARMQQHRNDFINKTKQRRIAAAAAGAAAGSALAIAVAPAAAAAATSSSPSTSCYIGGPSASSERTPASERGLLWQKADSRPRRQRGGTFFTQMQESQSGPGDGGSDQTRSGEREPAMSQLQRMRSLQQCLNWRLGSTEGF